MCKSFSEVFLASYNHGVTRCVLTAYSWTNSEVIVMVAFNTSDIWIIQSTGVSKAIIFKRAANGWLMLKAILLADV